MVDVGSLLCSGNVGSGICIHLDAPTCAVHHTRT